MTDSKREFKFSFSFCTGSSPGLESKARVIKRAGERASGANVQQLIRKNRATRSVLAFRASSYIPWLSFGLSSLRLAMKKH